MINLIKGQDLFGHPVRLNFKRSGSTINTTLGGMTSILIKAAIIMFLVRKV